MYRLACIFVLAWIAGVKQMCNNKVPMFSFDTFKRGPIALLQMFRNDIKDYGAQNLVNLDVEYRDKSCYFMFW